LCSAVSQLAGSWPSITSYTKLMTKNVD